MLLINGIDSSPRQHNTVILPDGKTLDLQMEFIPMQLGWFVTLTYGDFVLKKRRIVTSPNMLHQFKNIIPIGLACLTDDDEEPFFMNDFESGRAKLYILDSTDVAQFEEILSGKV